MKKIMKSYPILSFIKITFLISVPLDFSSVWFDIPKDVAFGITLIAVISPLIAGLIMLFVNSGNKINLGSKKIFLLTVLICSSFLITRLLLLDNGMPSKWIPQLQDMSIMGYLLAGIAIFIIALNLSQINNSILKENYIKSFLFNRNKVNWYLFALLSGPLFFGISYILGNLFELQTSPEFFKANWRWPINFLLVFLLTGAMEEFGWRGFLQKEMQKKYNPLYTALVAAFLWHLWHLPSFYNGFYSTGGIADSVEKFMFTIPATIILHWLYNKSKYSLLAVMLLHAMYDTVHLAFGDSMLITFALMVLFSIYCIFEDKMWIRKSYQFDADKEIASG